MLTGYSNALKEKEKESERVKSSVYLNRSNYPVQFGWITVSKIFSQSHQVFLTFINVIWYCVTPCGKFRFYKHFIEGYVKSHFTTIKFSWE